MLCIHYNDIKAEFKKTLDTTINYKKQILYLQSTYTGRTGTYFLRQKSLVIKSVSKILLIPESQFH